MNLNIALRFAVDEDMLEFESKLDQGNGNGIAPRTDRNGNPVANWDRYHQKAMNQIDRMLRGRGDTAEPSQLGQLSARSKARLRECAACFAIHFLFVDKSQSDDPFLADKASHYWKMATSMFDSESINLDYDSDNSGSIDSFEKNQPFGARVIRG